MADKNNITLEQLQNFAERADKRLDRLELNSPIKQALLLSADGWTNDSGDTEYPYRYALTVDGITTDSRVDAELDDGSVAVAKACGMYAFTETTENTVVFKSIAAPENNLTGVMYITRTAAMSGT